MTLNRYSLFAALSLAVAIPAFAQSSAVPAKPLTGGDVLDYDGKILRGSLEQQANAANPPPVQTITPAAPVVPPHLRDITLDVYGVDASAIGGPIENHASIRYNNRYLTVSVRSHVGSSLRVFRITEAGTTLAGLHGKKPYTIFLPRMDEADADARGPLPVATSTTPANHALPVMSARPAVAMTAPTPVAQPPMLTAPTVIVSPAITAPAAPVAPRIASTSSEPESPPHLAIPGLPTSAAH